MTEDHFHPDRAALAQDSLVKILYRRSTKRERFHLDLVVFRDLEAKPFQ